MMRKRGVLTLLALSLTAKIAAAEDLLIKGKEYPLIVIVPFVLVAVIWIVLFLIWIKRNMHKISLVIYNLGINFSRFFNLLGLKKLGERLSRLKQKAEAPGAEKPKEDLQKEAREDKGKKDLTPFLDQIEGIETQLPKFKEEIVFKNLANLIRQFFATLLNIQYEFTEAELTDLLEKKKKSLVQFAQKLAELKYSGIPLSKEDVIGLTAEFKEIVEYYVRAGWKPKKVSEGAIQGIIANDKKILERVKGYIDFLKQESRKSQIKDLLDDEKKVLGKNIKAIKKRYNKILRFYVQLTPAEKAKIYPELIGFYNTINSAIFSTFYSDKSKKELEYFAEQLSKMKKAPRQLPWIIKAKRALFSRKKQEIPAKTAKVPKTELKAPVPEAIPESVPAGKGMPSLEPVFRRLISTFQKEIPVKKVEIELPSKSIEELAARLKEDEPIAKPIARAKEMPAVKIEPEIKTADEMFQKPSKKEAMPEERQPSEDERQKQEIQARQEQMQSLPSQPIQQAYPVSHAAIMEIERLIREPIEKIDYPAKVNALVASAMKDISLGRISDAESAYYEIRLNYEKLEKRDQNRLYAKILALFRLLEAERQKKAKELRMQKRIEELRLKRRMEREQRIRAEQEKEEKEIAAKSLRTIKKARTKIYMLDNEKKEISRLLDKMPEEKKSRISAKDIEKKEARLERQITDQKKAISSYEKEDKEARKKAVKALSKLTVEEEKLAKKILGIAKGL